MTLRPATLADVSLLAPLNKQLIDDEGSCNPMTVDGLAERMRGFLDAGGYEAILFERDDATLGYALFRREPDRVHLRQFFVCPKHRRAGVGRVAFARLRAEAWAGGRVTLDVLAGNARAITFWRALGFRDYAVAMTLDT